VDGVGYLQAFLSQEYPGGEREDKETRKCSFQYHSFFSNQI
jgi:hypothetical protein